MRPPRFRRANRAEKEGGSAYAKAAPGTADAAHAGAPHAEAPHEHLSPWPFFIAMSVLVLYYGVIFRGPMLGLGVLFFLASVYGWVYEDYMAWKKGGAHVEEHAVDPDASTLQKWIAKPGAWWGIVIFLLTEVMLFGGLFALYFNAKAGKAEWPPAGSPTLPVMNTGVNTAILVASGFTMHFGIMALKRNMRTMFLALFAATIFLGAWFLFNQVTEYLELMGEGFNVSSGVYGGAFYALTGVHGAHVTAGLAGLTCVFVRGALGQFDAKRHLGIEGVAIYWHFVDVVWIFLYLVIYVRILG
jgi:cytochrome c oxidase subunit 3